LHSLFYFHQLAMHADKGEYVEASPSRAAKFYELAAQHPSYRAVALFHLGCLLYTGSLQLAKTAPLQSESQRKVGFLIFFSMYSLVNESSVNFCVFDASIHHRSQQAEECWRQSAAGGFGPSYFQLGSLVLDVDLQAARKVCWSIFH
jgi:hypothetical protein